MKKKELTQRVSEAICIFEGACMPESLFSMNGYQKLSNFNKQSTSLTVFFAITVNIRKHKLSSEKLLMFVNELCYKKDIKFILKYLINLGAMPVISSAMN